MRAAVAGAAAVAVVGLVAAARRARPPPPSPPPPPLPAPPPPPPSSASPKSAAACAPRRIILVRHGESEGNVDHAAYSRIPDSRIRLTERGLRQARAAGHALGSRPELVGPRAPFRVYYSPYMRSRQTALEVVKGIVMAPSADSQGPDADTAAAATAAQLARINMMPEPRLREQDFGNFQDAADMRRQQRTRREFGRFFYRFREGESGADVYDRVGSFVGTLKRSAHRVKPRRPGDGETRVPAEAVVLVSHGLAIRLFLMRYLKWSVKQFDGVWNPKNCDIWVLERRGADGAFELVSNNIRFGDVGGPLPDAMRAVRTAKDATPPFEKLAWEVAQDLSDDRYHDGLARL